MRYRDSSECVNYETSLISHAIINCVICLILAAVSKLFEGRSLSISVGVRPHLSTETSFKEAF